MQDSLSSSSSSTVFATMAGLAVKTTGRSQATETTVPTKRRSSVMDGKEMQDRADRYIFRLKLCVLLMLLLVTISAGFLVYTFFSKEEQEKFEYHYHAATGRVLAAIGRNVDHTLGAADAMAVTMSIYAKHANSTWPFVTLPSFYLRTKKYSAQSTAVLTQVYHLVTAEQRSDWQQYTATHNQWIDHDLALQAKDPTYDGPIIQEREDFNVIHGWDEFDKENPGVEGTNRTGPLYLPNWQSSPVIPKYPIYNWDFLSQFDTSMVLPVLEKRGSIITQAYLLPDPDNQAEIDEANITADFYKDYIDPDENPMEPFSDIFYPVLKDMDEAVHWDTNTLQEQTLVAIVAVSFYWRDLLKDILTEETGIDVVFQNECNPTFTYRLDGSSVQYLGRGDHHMERYDHLRSGSKLADLNDFAATSTPYTGILVDSEHCPFEISLYPSPSMEDQYKSSYPVIFTILTVIVLVFTFSVFLLYDCQVGERQHRTNQFLEEANQRLRQSSALQLRHFAMMSHEIRTPLNGILGMASLVAGENLTSSQQESVQMIQSSGELLRAVVDDVLDYSKLAAGHMNIELGSTGLQEILAAVMYSIQTKANEKGITLRTNFAENLPATAYTDGRRLQQILFNLLSNAIKFSPENETVVLGADFRPKCIPISADSGKPLEYFAKEPILRFYVEDHGEGIHEDSYDKIFQPFAQATIQTERIYGGTGLGLSITKKLVDALGGSVMVESEPGRFTRFTVQLPYEEAGEDDFEPWGGAFIEQTTVHIVCNDNATVKKLDRIFRHFQMCFQAHSSIQAIEASKDPLWASPDHHIVVLVDEDLFHLQAYQHLVSSNCNIALITFGPQMSKNPNGCHLRSLGQMIPATLVFSIYQATRKLRPDLAVTPERPTITANISIEKLRVLVAEDNLINQKVIARILSRLCIQNVDIVDNGQKAVAAEASEPFDIVLMDLEMPVLDGLAACKQIQLRIDGDHPRASVVFLTAHALGDIRNECLEAGAVDFLSKPYKIEEVARCLRDVALELAQAGSSPHLIDEELGLLSQPGPLASSY